MKVAKQFCLSRRTLVVITQVCSGLPVVYSLEVEWYNTNSNKCVIDLHVEYLCEISCSYCSV